MDLEQLWQSTLGEVELQISRPNFLTWLKNSKLTHKENGVVFVSLPNNFAKEWVENKYNKTILSVLRNFDDSAKKVEYVVENKNTAATSAKVIAKQKSLSEVDLRVQQSFAELRIDPETGLNPRYTLESFVVGSSNELAYTAAMAIIKDV